MSEPGRLKLQKNDLKTSLGFSLALHSAVLSLFLVKFIFFPESKIDLSQAISVSVGDFTESQKLPEKTATPAEDNKLPPKITEPVSEPANKTLPIDKVQADKTDVVNLKTSKAKQKAALDKLRKATALDKIKQDLKNDSIDKLKSQIKKSASSSSRSRIIMAGTVLSGLDKLQANGYLQELDQNIKKFWALPQWLINKAYKAQLLVKFNVQGQILSLKIISSSGNSSYDQYCIRAVEKAAPFAEVPEKLTEKFSIDGIVIGFPE